MLRLRVVWSGLAPGVSVLHFNPAADDQAAADAARTHVETWLNVVNNYVSVLEGMTVDTEVDVVDVGSGALTGSFNVTTTLIVGASSDNPVPNAAMGLSRWRTGVFIAGRELRGRTFIPAITEVAIDANGNLASAPKAVLEAANLALITNSDLAIWTPTHAAVASVSATSWWGEFAILRSRRQ